MEEKHYTHWIMQYQARVGEIPFWKYVDFVEAASRNIVMNMLQLEAEDRISPPPIQQIFMGNFQLSLGTALHTCFETFEEYSVFPFVFTK
jgi:hypothetical protein